MNDSIESPMPDKPSPKHTEIIYCCNVVDGTECCKPRWVKPQDVFQVKYCLGCRDEIKGKKQKQSFEKMKARVEVKEQVKAAITRPELKKLCHEAGMRAVIAYRKANPYRPPVLPRVAGETGLRRVWPR